MEPLSKIWHALESSTTAPDDEADLNIQDLLKLVQQTVLLVVQTNNTISYHRQLGALVGVMKSSSQAKSLIKDKSALLENSGKELFGKEFLDQITDIVKALKQSKELLFNSLPASPFRKAPPQSKLHRGGQNISFKRRSDDSSSRKGFNSGRFETQVPGTQVPGARFQGPDVRCHGPGAMDQVPGVRD